MFTLFSHIIYISGSQPFFHLRIPWQPISINFNLHISKMFVINIGAVTSNLRVDVCAFSAIIQFFSHTPKCCDSYPWRYAYPRLGISDIHDATCILNTNIQCSLNILFSSYNFCYNVSLFSATDFT